MGSERVERGDSGVSADGCLRRGHRRRDREMNGMRPTGRRRRRRKRRGRKGREVRRPWSSGEAESTARGSAEEEWVAWPRGRCGVRNAVCGPRYGKRRKVEEEEEEE